MSIADEIIATLQLQPHPREGGYFRETYRAAQVFAANQLPDYYGAPRHASTAIYYLLKPGTFSAIHRLQTDEVFHFYAGSPVEMIHLYPDGTGQEVILGSDVLAGQQPQVLVPHGVWQGAQLVPGGEFALLGCTVSPGFDYADYEHGDRATLIEQYPKFEEVIKKLTHGS